MDTNTFTFKKPRMPQITWMFDWGARPSRVLAKVFRLRELLSATDQHGSGRILVGRLCQTPPKRYRRLIQTPYNNHPHHPVNPWLEICRRVSRDGCELLGSTRVPRVGFGGLAETIFVLRARKVRRREDATTSTRDGRAPQSRIRVIRAMRVIGGSPRLFLRFVLRQRRALHWQSAIGRIRRREPGASPQDFIETPSHPALKARFNSAPQLWQRRCYSGMSKGILRRRCRR
jgi:hypothetical protein